MTSGKDMRALARPTSAMHYRLADNLDIDALCRQPLRLQKIHDRNGHTIILAVSDEWVMRMWLVRKGKR